MGGPFCDSDRVGVSGLFTSPQDQVLGRGESTVYLETEVPQLRLDAVSPVGSNHPIVQLEYNFGDGGKLSPVEELALGALGVDHEECGPNLVHQVIQRLSGNLHWMHPRSAPHYRG
jgi:hypothetical protein